MLSWHFDNEVESILSEYTDYVKILKPHPHIRLNVETNTNFDYILSGSLIIEFLISELEKSDVETVVIHHNSSAMMYFNDAKNIKSINLIGGIKYFTTH